MVVTNSNNKITTMIEAVVEGVAHEAVGGAMDPVEVEVMTISKSHHQVCICMCTYRLVSIRSVENVVPY